ncbi:hypothetical protein L7F22_005418 [Adiantum nelumboides]|nr:hypothetical protein [Adiantum nelumboides]
MNADLSKDKDMREQIEDFIRCKRRTLLSFGGTRDEDGQYMSEKVIFQKLNGHLCYLQFKAMSFSSEKNRLGRPYSTIYLEDNENQTQDSLDSMESPRHLTNNQKGYQRSVSCPKNVATMGDECCVLAGSHELVSIIGSPQILSHENISYRYGLFPQDIQQPYVFIPFLDGDTKEIAIGTIFSKSYNGNTYAKWNLSAKMHMDVTSLEALCKCHVCIFAEELKKSCILEGFTVKVSSVLALAAIEGLMESTWKMFDIVESGEDHGVSSIKNFALMDLTNKKSSINHVIISRVFSLSTPW